MKTVFGLGAAVVLVLLQLAAVATWPSEAELHLAPVDIPSFGAGRPA